jgi:enamidase
MGSTAKDALGAISGGDIPGISGIVIDGHLQVRRSRNTPLATRLASFDELRQTC